MICSFFHQLRGFAEFQHYQELHQAELLAQRAYEQTVWSGRSDFHLSGYCAGCRKVMPLKVDLHWGDGIKPNWRERLECACGLNNRIRASLDFLDELVGANPEPNIYATEQLTALYRQLRTRYPKVTGSEFLRDRTGSGLTNPAGIRHEDLTRLSFASASVDVVLSFDVLEHVPDYRAALAEIARVLTPNGYLLASFPFDANQPKTVVRASLTNEGKITHHLPPEYHGDPVDSSGCLCFQVFGWDVLEEMKAAGFSDAYTVFYWSVDRGYLGPNQLLIVGRR
jgi:SAM-dependent methyltransferase